MIFDLVVYFQIFLVSMILLVFMYKYMLILLILLELVVINLSLILFLIFGIFNKEYYLVYFLVFSVCEGVLGLSLLVLIVRFFGSDLYYLFNISKFN